MRVEQDTVYVAEDGKKFATEVECVQHEKDLAEQQRRISRLKVYVVNSSFDSTEGRGYGRKTYVLSDASLTELIQWCLDKYGPPLCQWYGDGYYEAWRIIETSKTPEEAIKMIGKPVPSIGTTYSKAHGAFVSNKNISGLAGLPPREFPWPRPAKK